MISRREFLAGTVAAMAALPVQETMFAHPETPAQTETARREKTLFRVLGSCASEGCPSPFCTCDLCVQARTRGGKDVRTRAGYQLGDSIRIDWSPDAFAQGIKFNLDPCLLRHIFITHTHSDHLLPLDFWTRGIVMKHDDSVVKVYGNKEVIKRVGAALLAAVILTAAAALGLCRNEVRLPLTPLSPEHGHMIKEEMQKAGLIC